MHRIRTTAAAVCLAASVAVMSGQGKPAAPEPVALDGAWKLNRELSQFPRDLGFGMDVIGGGKTTITDPGGRGGGGQSMSPGLAANRPASREEAENSRQLVNEVRNPPERLTIASSAGAIVVTNEGGRARTYYPDGREAFTPLDTAPVATVTRWDAAGRLVIRYKVEPAREVRYTVSRKSSPPQLVVQAELLERGGRDSVLRIYEPAGGEAPVSAPQAPDRAAPQAPSLLTLPSQRPSTPQAQQAPADPARTGLPAAAAPANLDQRPGAELKGLSSIGVVVEDLGSEAVACGLKQDALDAAVSKSLSSAGLKVVRETDEDTYLYVRVITLSTTSGYCFSRYDAYIYTNTTATLSYGSRPALVQVSLMHKGGISGSATKGHGDAVVRTITQYVDQFGEQIRSANK